MDVIEAIHGRRAIRDFRPDPLERTLVETIIWDAAQAPPPFSGQTPWTFAVVEGVQRLADIGAQAKRFAHDERTGEAPGWTENPDFRVFWGAPAAILICGPLADCCRAGQNLMLSAHARGLGTCWVGAPLAWLETEAARSELGLGDLIPAAVLCVGWPAEAPPTPSRARPPILWL